jgi:hypothetical protein
MTKTSNDSKATKLPSHRVYAVKKGENGEKSFWREIGAAWEHSDGKGFGVKLDYLPLNGAEIVIRTPKDEPAKEADTTATDAAHADKAVDRTIAKKKAI